MTESKAENWYAVVGSEAEWLRRLSQSLLAESDDLTQETLLAALKRDGDIVVSPRGYLVKLARHLASRFMRAKSRRYRHETAGARSEIVQEESGTVTLERLETARRIVAAVEALAEPLRTAVRLRYFDDLSIAAIATRTGASEGAIRTRLSRANAELRRRLESDFGAGGQTWSVALLPFAASGFKPSRVGAALGVLLMAKKFAAFLGILALALGFFVWKTRGGDADERLPVESAGATTRSEAEVRRTPAPTSSGDAAPTEASAPASRLAASARSTVIAVVDENGAPIPGAELRFFAGRRPEADGVDLSATARQRFGEIAPTRAARTDSTGRYATPADLTGTYFVEASAPGRVIDTQFAVAVPETASLRFVLGPCGTVRCIAVDTDDRPVSDAEVAIHYRAAGVRGGNPTRIDVVRARPDGTFEFPALSQPNAMAAMMRGEATQTLYVRRSNEATGRQFRWDAAPVDSEGRLKAVVAPTRRLRAQFEMAEAGESLPSRLAFLVESSEERFTARFEGDPRQGIDFEMPSTSARFLVCLDEPDLFVVGDKSSALGRKLIQAPTGVESVAIPIHRGREVRGRVLSVNDEKPVEGLELQIRPHRAVRNDHRFKAVTDTAGRFAFLAPIADLAFKTTASDWCLHGAGDAGFVVRIQDQDDVLVKVAKRAVARGRVIDRAAKPIPGALLRLIESTPPSPFGALNAEPPTLSTRPTDAEGRFELVGITPGLEYKLEVSKSGYRTFRLDALRAEPGEVRDGVQIRLDDEVVIRLRCSDALGNLVAGLQLRIDEAGTPAGQSHEVSTDSNGEAVLRDLRAGDAIIRLRPSPEPWCFKAGPVVIEEIPGDRSTTVDIPMVRGLALDLRVVDDAGIPAAGAHVVVTTIATDDPVTAESLSFTKRPVDAKDMMRHMAIQGLRSMTMTTDRSGRAPLILRDHGRLGIVVVPADSAALIQARRDHPELAFGLEQRCDISPREFDTRSGLPTITLSNIRIRINQPTLNAASPEKRADLESRYPQFFDPK